MEHVRVEDLRRGDLVDTGNGKGWGELIDRPVPNRRSMVGGLPRWGFTVRFADGYVHKVSGPEGLELPARRASE